jgi:hypothetical protein
MSSTTVAPHDAVEMPQHHVRDAKWGEASDFIAGETEDGEEIQARSEWAGAEVSK